MGDWKVVILEIVLRIRGFTLPAYWTDQVLDKFLTDLMEHFQGASSNSHGKMTRAKMPKGKIGAMAGWGVFR